MPSFLTRCTMLGALLGQIALAGLALPAFAAAGTPDCAAQACFESPRFNANVANLRATKQGSSRLVALTLQFTNKSAAPLTLGYVNASGSVTDELGNRYVVPGISSVRAIGAIDGANFDPKFTLAAGESREARLEFAWKDAGNTAAGTQFELDLAIREIVAGANEQYKLGQEHALFFTALNDTAGRAVAKNAPAAVTPTVSDPCAGKANCFNGGAFIAEVQQVTPTNFTPAGRHHSIKINVRFTNVGATPVVLGYKSGTNNVTDNFGNRYLWGRPSTHDTSSQGIGLVTGRAADPQFVLSPGQSRIASFGVTRFNAKEPIGTIFQYDVVITELEVIGNQQVRSIRDNSLSFAALRAGAFNTAGAATTDGAAAVRQVIDLFRPKNKQ